MQSKRRIRNTKTSSAIAAEQSISNAHHLEASQRLEWAKQRGASAEGDIMRTPRSSQQSQPQLQRPNKNISVASSHRQQQQYQRSSKSETTPLIKKNHNGEQVISLTENQIEDLIKNRLQQTENETIMTLKKQLDDLKFFHELEKQQKHTKKGR